MRISIGRRGRWRDNAFVEWLRRLIEYESVYLKFYNTISETHSGLASYIAFFNTRRPHAGLDRRTPDAVYLEAMPRAEAAKTADLHLSSHKELSWVSDQPLVAVNDMDRMCTKASVRQVNTIRRRFNRTVLSELYQVAVRENIYGSIGELQTDLDAWLIMYNHERKHQGKICSGQMAMKTLEEGKRIWRKKTLA